MPGIFTPTSDGKLVGKNYPTPDLIAKVTGRAKYAEDYRAEGMLFARLVLSPYPHAKIRKIDASAAMAMPGVKAILTVDDLPAPADSLTDNGTVIKANRLGDQGLTMEPVYQGEPILAVCAVDEFTCRRAIEKITSIMSACRTWSIRSKRCGPAARIPEAKGNVWVRPARSASPGQPPSVPVPMFRK